MNSIQTVSFKGSFDKIIQKVGIHVRFQQSSHYKIKTIGDVSNQLARWILFPVCLLQPSGTIIVGNVTAQLIRNVHIQGLHGDIVAVGWYWRWLCIGQCRCYRAMAQFQCE